MPAVTRRLSQAFKAYDPNQTGYICYNNMSHVLKSLSMDDNLVDSVLLNYNKSGDDLIEYKDFLSWFMEEGAATENRDIHSTYAIKDILGAGAFGTVRKATHHASGVVYAVKTIKMTTGNEQAVNDEISIMRTVDHPNVVCFLDVFREPDVLHIAMELCSGGTLLDRLLDKLGFSESQAAPVMQQISAGIAHIHSLSICHRDLKPQNILFQEAGMPVEKCTVKIADFGLAKRFTDNQVFTSPVGSPSYAAPEVLLGEYRNSCDLWSAGVIAYVSLSMDPPFKGKDDVEVLSKVIEGQYNFDGPGWSNISATAKDFVSGLMEYQPSARRSAVQALQHQWLRSSGLNTSKQA